MIMKNNIDLYYRWEYTPNNRSTSRQQTKDEKLIRRVIMKRTISIILSIVMMISMCVVSVAAEGDNTFSLTSDYAVTQVIERSMIDQTNKSGIYADAGQTFTLFVSPSNTEPSAPQQILVENDKIMIRNSVDNEGTLSWGEWRILNDPGQQNPNAGYVVCDGNNDELKIQKAIDNGVKVIYPIGTCVITNENTSTGDGDLSDHQVVINLKQDVTLDGMYCDELIFKNSAPAEKQVIFQLADGAKFKNVKMREEDCTVDTVNPMIFFGGECEVSDCSFSNLYDPYGMHGMYFYKGKFMNNMIDGWSLHSFGNIAYSFYCKAGSMVENNVFQNITNDPESYYSVMVIYDSQFNNNKFSNCNFQRGTVSIRGNMSGNTFSDIEDVSFELQTNVSGNHFFDINNVMFQLNGLTSGNTFEDIDDAFFEMAGMVSQNKFMRLSSQNYYMFDVQPFAVITNNVFQGCNSNGSYAFELLSDSSFCNNQITTFRFFGYDKQYIFTLQGDNVIISGNNIRKAKAPKPGENDNIYVVEKNPYVDGTICANNITDYKSMGEFTDTCKVVNNIVDEESTN